MTQLLEASEIQQLQNIQSNRVNLVEEFGNIEMQIQELIIKKNLIIGELTTAIFQEKQISKTLQEKYGEGTINLDKGEFISN